MIWVSNCHKMFNPVELILKSFKKCCQPYKNCLYLYYCFHEIFKYVYSVDKTNKNGFCKKN